MYYNEVTVRLKGQGGKEVYGEKEETVAVGFYFSVQLQGFF